MSSFDKEICVASTIYRQYRRIFIKERIIDLVYEFGSTTEEEDMSNRRMRGNERRIGRVECQFESAPGTRLVKFSKPKGTGRNQCK